MSRDDECLDDDGFCDGSCACDCDICDPLGNDVSVEDATGFSTDETPPHGHFCDNCGGRWFHSDATCVADTVYDCPECM